MGLDRFSNFISRIITNIGIDELFIDNNMHKIISNHIIYDINFIIYQEIIEIENEINDIIKILLCIPYALNYNDIQNLINTIICKEYWNDLDIHISINSDYNNIIKNFLYNILSTEKLNISKVDLLIYNKIFYIIKKYINNIHYNDFIQSILIFFDGIPTISKVIEQRRRRIKNYLESQEKKNIYNTFFDKLILYNNNLYDSLSNKNIINNINTDLYFDYINWIEYRFMIDKSLGPSSLFIKNLEIVLYDKLINYYSKYKIYINSAQENGEADFKIFKYINKNNNIIDNNKLSKNIINNLENNNMVYLKNLLQDNNISLLTSDYCIHTTDSDLIHQMLVQQVYYKLTNKDINLSIIKYNKNNNNIILQFLDANLIIKNILDLYNNINNIKTSNIKIIWDICLIFYFFGNDHLPSSLEIGPELGFDYFLKNHYSALNKSNIVNLLNNKININFINLSLYLQKINSNNSNNITKIILQRYFKINIQLINLFIDKLNYNFDNILLFLKKFIIYKGLHLTEYEYNNLNNNDLRKIFCTNNKNIYILDSEINIFIKYNKLIEDNINYYEIKYNGLILYHKSFTITNDIYYDLYNYNYENILNNLISKYPQYYEYCNLEDYLIKINNFSNNYNYNKINNYLKYLFYLVYIQFGSMENFHNDNITFYKYNDIPSLYNIINFLSNININKINQWFLEIYNDNLTKEYYLNTINHYILITPYLLHVKNLNIEIFKNIKYKQYHNDKYLLFNEFYSIINKILILDNLFIKDFSNYNYKDIDINKFFYLWNSIFNKHSYLLEFNI